MRCCNAKVGVYTIQESQLKLTGSSISLHSRLQRGKIFVDEANQQAYHQTSLIFLKHGQN